MNGTGHFTFSEDTTLFDAGLINTSGAAFVDYDRDGFLDLWMGNWFLDYRGTPEDVYSPEKLYKGNGDGSFTDVSEESGINEVNVPSYGICVADTNNDGWPDLFTGNYCRGESLHFSNNGDGTFTEVHGTSQYGLWVGPVKHLCSWGTMPRDYDNDGDIDLFELLVHGNKNYHSCPLINTDNVFEWDFDYVAQTEAG